MIPYSIILEKGLCDNMKGYTGKIGKRILWGEHNHMGIQPLHLFPEKKIIRPEK